MWAFSASHWSPPLWRFYNPIAHNRFIEFDDGVYITVNPHVQQGLTWDTTRWAFTTFHAGYWHPLTWLSHALDCQIFHLNPAGHHYVNLLLHAVNAILLVLLLRSATRLNRGQLRCRRIVRLAPRECRVRRLGGGAKERFEHAFLFARDARLQPLCAEWREVLVCIRTGSFRAWPDGKAADRNSAVCASALGLLAAGKTVAGTRTGTASAAYPSRSLRFPDCRKTSALCSRRRRFIIIVLAQRAAHAVRTASEVSWTARIANALVSYVRYIEPRHSGRRVSLPCIRARRACRCGKWPELQHC